MGQDKLTALTHYYFYSKREADRGLSGFIPILVLAIHGRADNMNVKTVSGISVKGRAN